MQSSRPPFVDPDPTVGDLPRHKLAKREQLERVAVQRLATEATDAGFSMYAVCASCGASVRGWRAHLHELKRARGPSDFPLLEYVDACSVCGGSVVEVHAEDRPG